MGAVFALFSGWYFWIPKILGLDYNILLSKVHFWILFIGVKRGRFNFYERGKRFNHQLPGGSPNDKFEVVDLKNECFYKMMNELFYPLFVKINMISTSQSFYMLKTPIKLKY